MSATQPKVRPASRRIDDGCDLMDEVEGSARYVRTYTRAEVIGLCEVNGYGRDMRERGFDPKHTREIWYDDESLTVVCDVRLPDSEIPDEEEES